MERPIFTEAEQIILNEVRDNKKTTEDIKNEVVNMKICHLENKNDIRMLNERFQTHLENHDLISKPLINWIFGGGFVAAILSLIYFIFNKFLN